MRDIGYWFLDALKGGKIKSHYNEVKFIQENYNSRNSREIRAENLIKLLQHAVNNTPYYKKYIGFESIIKELLKRISRISYLLIMI